MSIEIPELETECKRCEGEGTYRDCGERGICYECDGAGYVPSEFGKKFAELARHQAMAAIRHYMKRLRD